MAEFIYEVKELGYLVKLDTNGYRPKVLQRLLEGHLLDYVAMDIKAGPSGYKYAAGLQQIDLEKIKTSIDILLHSAVQYEFRTTVAKGLHREADFAEIGPFISGCREYFLQNYKENDNVMMPGFTGFTKDELESFANQVRPYVGRVSLRGVE